MARHKQATPLHREHSSEYTSSAGRIGTPTKLSRTLDSPADAAAPIKANGHVNGASGAPVVSQKKKQAGLLELVIGVAGIYASFLTWALLQERLTTTPYGPAGASEVFKFPIVLNTIQSLFAVLTGLSYLHLSRPANAPTPAIFPTRAITLPLAAVALTASLASPFGYASLAHIDYITFILAKSCKLLPVMFLHVTLFGRRYPWYKYLVVFTVTAGVAVFTLHASSAKKHASKAGAEEKNRAWGLVMLGVNLLLDGLTNTTQDYIFKMFQPYSGPQMMCATNILASALTISYLMISPLIATTPLGVYLGLDLTSAATGGEFPTAMGFLNRNPAAWVDVLGFAACGAVGQLFIFYTLSVFDSVLLVTVTVTRKMCTMVLSVLWFGHRLSVGQWVGVGLVFGGVGGKDGWRGGRRG
ncbi:UDP-galactose transporter [Pseudogymnoascus destructans]|uniref:UDP-galactose transporter homolog 1 n=1 Tax=Pseudogymnoascus destructans TaxID=655981 RepID=A0A177A9S7_9PEZI|nr:UDP-galactose transporter [Pseudogymnoascus destructans]OAF58152.1 UDP-galactose transporter [Pseudogymnoascus destructans]